MLVLINTANLTDEADSSQWKLFVSDVFILW